MYPTTVPLGSCPKMSCGPYFRTSPETQRKGEITLSMRLERPRPGQPNSQNRTRLSAPEAEIRSDKVEQNLQIWRIFRICETKFHKALTHALEGRAANPMHWTICTTCTIDSRRNFGNPLVPWELRHLRRSNSTGPKVKNRKIVILRKVLDVQG